MAATAAAASMSSLRISYRKSHASAKPKFLMHFTSSSTSTRTSLLPCKRVQTRLNRAPKRLVTVSAGADDSKPEDTTTPLWAKPDSDEPPPWARGEGKNDGPVFQIPFYGYLLASTITAIAAIGSIFEYINQKPIFGLLNSDSIFYAPILGFFAFSGVPTSAFLWFKSVQAANKEAEEQDKRDGYYR